MVLALIAAETTDQGAAFFAYMGVAAALVFANLGASYGTAKAGVGIASLGVIDSSKITKSLIPIIMAGILGIYGVIVAVLINSNFKPENYGDYGKGYKIFSGGLCCGLSSLAAGLAIGVAGDAGVRAYAQTDAIFVGMILILIFAECIGLYGMIIAIILTSA
jgi:V-type H+-transporting ATPase proteolipid subunit